MSEIDTSAVRERHEKAQQLVYDLCKYPEEWGSRRWSMSIPAQPDYDPDIVLSRSLADIPTLLARIERLERVASAARELRAVEELPITGRQDDYEREVAARDVATQRIYAALDALKEANDG